MDKIPITQAEFEKQIEELSDAIYDIQDQWKKEKYVAEHRVVEKTPNGLEYCARCDKFGIYMKPSSGTQPLYVPECENCGYKPHNDY